MDATNAYIKYFFILANIVLTMFVISAGSFFFDPLLAALIIAILLNPFYDRLIRLGFPRVISAVSVVSIFILAMIMLFTFIMAQLRFISTDPDLNAGVIVDFIKSAHAFITQFIDYSLQDQTQLMASSLNNFIKGVIIALPNAFSGTTAYLSMFLLFFISLFFFLYYRGFLINFIYKLSGEAHIKKVKDTTTKIEFAVKRYIVGVVVVITLVATANSIGLALLGIKHALFFGIVGAMLTIVPYFGIIIGSIVPTAYALMTTNSLWYAAGVIFVFSFVQFLEGNFLTPLIVGQRANINPYVAILGLFLGGMLLGTVGVIFAIPLLGILKIIFDHIESLRPISYVMGNPYQEIKILDSLEKLFKKHKKNR